MALVSLGHEILVCQSTYLARAISPPSKRFRVTHAITANHSHFAISLAIIQLSKTIYAKEARAELARLTTALIMAR